MPVKTRKTITVDPRVWDRAEAEARRLRVSNSWVAETAIRKYLRIVDKPVRIKADDSQPAA